LTGSISIFKKIQNDVILIKKVNGLQPSFAGSPGQPLVGRVTPSHDFSYFFINPAWFQFQVDRPGRVSKLYKLVLKDIVS
jgi:hypothetical protein